MQYDPSSASLPPPPNPILDSYLNFKQTTPLVTRYVLTSQAICYCLSFLFDPTYAFSNNLYFTVQQYEVYRIILSPFLCTRFLSLVFAYLSFTENGRRLELSMGSTGFLVLLFTIGTLTNILYTFITFLLWTLTESQLLLFLSASGIWIILFGIISIECSQAPPHSMRKLFFFPVQATYYPLALFGVFSLFGMFDSSYLISIGVGYAYGHGYLDKIKPGSPRCKGWEDSILEDCANREGWVACNNVLGSGAWNEESNAPSSGGSGLFSQLQQRYQQVSTNASDPSDTPSSANNNGTGDGEELSFPTSGGQKLGSASRRQASSVEPRQARLQAIERRMDAESKGDIV